MLLMSVDMAGAAMVCHSAMRQSEQERGHAQTSAMNDTCRVERQRAMSLTRDAMSMLLPLLLLRFIVYDAAIWLQRYYARSMASSARRC